MLYIQNPEILTFDQAVRDVHAKIDKRWTSFVVNTEFGRIFFEVTRNHWEPIYRYSINKWADAPNNKHTADHIRDTSIDYYILIGRVNDSVIQKMMIIMALTTILIEYISGRFVAGRDDIDALAFSYMSDRCICKNAGRYPSDYSLAEHYLNTLTSGLIFKRVPDEDCRNFVDNFFTERVKTAKNVIRKIEGSLSDHDGPQVAASIHDDFYKKVLCLIVREKQLGTKRGIETLIERQKKLLTDPDHIYNIPDFLKTLINGENK